MRPSSARDGEYYNRYQQNDYNDDDTRNVDRSGRGRRFHRGGEFVSGGDNSRGRGRGFNQGKRTQSSRTFNEYHRYNNNNNSNSNGYNTSSNNNHNYRNNDYPDRNAQPKRPYYSLVSRGDSTAEDAVSLKERIHQENLFTELKEKIASVSKMIDKSMDEKNQRQNNENIVAEFRKLREGILSAEVYDDFAIQVYDHFGGFRYNEASLLRIAKPIKQIHKLAYEAAVDACMTAEIFHFRTQSQSNHIVMSELFKSLSSLIRTLYPATEWKSERAPQLTKYFLLYISCCSNPPLSESELNIIRPQRYLQKVFSADIIGLLKIIPNHVSENPELKRFLMFGKLLYFNIDYIKLGKFLDEVDEHEQIFLKFLIPQIRIRVLQILKRSYFTFCSYQLQYILGFREPRSLLAWLNSIDHDPPFEINDNIVTLRFPKTKTN